MVVSLVYIFAALAAVGFVLERLIPARPQPILRRGLVTDDLYVVINVVLRIGSPDRSLGPSRTQAVTCFPRGLVARPARLQAIAVIVVLDFFHWTREAPLNDWW